MEKTLSTICVYCGSADGLSELYLAAARELGILIASKGIHIVYGGGKTGLMGAFADGALTIGGYVIGIVPAYLNQPQLIHSGLSQLEIVADIHQRKARMSELAEAFIALPGGYGTLDELFETLTWAQTGLHHKPVALLNTNHYYDSLLKLIENASLEGFIYPEHKQLLLSDQSPSGVLEKLAHFTLPVGLDRWISRQ